MSSNFMATSLNSQVIADSNTGILDTASTAFVGGLTVLLVILAIFYASISAWPLALASIALIAGRLADRYHAGILGAIGLTSMTTGLVLTALLPPDPSTADIMWRLVLCGAGFGLFASPNNRLMMNAVPRDRSGSAGGIIASARTLGQTVGSALVALAFSLFDFSGGGAAEAARAAIWLGAGFAGVALVVGSLRMKLQR